MNHITGMKIIPDDSQFNGDSSKWWVTADAAARLIKRNLPRGVSISTYDGFEKGQPSTLTVTWAAPPKKMKKSYGNGYRSIPAIFHVSLTSKADFEQMTKETLERWSRFQDEWLENQKGFMATEKASAISSK